MVTFRELWDAVINALTAATAELGIDAGHIVKGTPFTQMKIQAPFIYVYCLPGDGDDNNSTLPSSGYADISVFCSPEPASNPEDSLIDAVELQGKIISVLNKINHIIQYQECGLEIGPNSRQTIAVTLYKGRYAYA